MRPPLRALCTAVVLAGAPAIARAGGDPNMILGGYVGAHVYSHANELGQPDEPTSESLDDSVAFGVRVARRVWRFVTAEGELSVSPTRSRVDEGVDVVVLGLRAQGLIAPWKLYCGRLEPFLLLGVGGATSASSNTAVVDNDTDLTFHTGLGASYQVKASWGVRADARAYFPPSSRGTGITTDWELLIGLYKTFPPGSTSPPPPPSAAP